MTLTTCPGPVLITAPAFRLLARRALHPMPCPAASVLRGKRYPSPSDFDLNPDASEELGANHPGHPAAVLVPVVLREPLTVLLTQRTHDLPAHAGQIAFPGGKMEEADSGAVATALREANEEIGLDPSLTEPLGFLDTYRTGTGFAITPVVAFVAPAFSLTLNSREVADAFEVPLPFLMDERNHRRDARTIAGRQRHYHAMRYGERYIWGATAGILKNMHERMFSL